MSSFLVFFILYYPYLYKLYLSIFLKKKKKKAPPSRHLKQRISWEWGDGERKARKEEERSGIYKDLSELI